MNLETLNDMWEKDSQLDDEKLDHDSLEIPKLHANTYDFTTLSIPYRVNKSWKSNAPTKIGGSTTLVKRRNHFH